MAEESKFKCLRCGYEYMAPFDKKEGPKERTCPQCRSNSVRRIEKSKDTK